MTYNKKVILFFSILILLAGMGFLGYLNHVVQKEPNENYITSEIDVRVKSEDLVATFIANESLANATYVEKTIEVEGIVKEVTFLNNRYTVILQGEGEYRCIMCDMKADQVNEAQSLSKGNSVVLKGICKGFLMDAILLNCVLVKQTNE